MAEHLNSTPIANTEATPRVTNNASVAGGLVRQAVGTVEVTAAATSGSTYRFVEVPSHATGLQVILSADAAGATGGIRIGVFETLENGDSVVEASFFANGEDITSEVLQADVTYNSTAGASYDIEDIEKPLWEVLGLSEDPQKTYVVGGTLSAAHANGGTVSLLVRWSE